ncbi:cytochrome-c oxidase, cbb3-type subunit III [Rhodoferax fermentans]|uniref:Cbb3-type cytochrome c oxidase subunit n=1 Tax=Rhodoferax fermentans TaxID=28066 RepID=A0A1T1AVI2_RHOFE|nr:cytochrome-c oxidase, cbb3-type subunit III [Rhodoferax fermentans]MBK1682072.1 cytochrome-c oxidase, cbb3-type subunit III [Rhodoferax fermentans]OOV08057.1 cytochrome-c oxidase, cbb3-type subunit III [Rhodoferax fermentans]
MSDFVNGFWSMYVAGLVVVSILACLVLLVMSGKAKAMTASDNTTGHVWDDDLREMNNPLPRWWSYLFVLTVIFGFGYLALYPGLGSYPGLLGWTSSGLHAAEIKQGEEQTAPVYARFANMTPQDIAKDPAAMAIGERLYSNNCAQCHASDAQGNKGFPNLTDGDWLHGGTPEKITETIQLGRVGNMPPMAAALGTEDDVKNVAQYVLSLSGSPHDAAKAALGKEKFAVCAACHGEDGKGMQALGSANLTDNIWLHGFGEKAIIERINNGVVNVMPAQAYHLTEPQIKVLTSYIWGLSNKQ